MELAPEIQNLPTFVNKMKSLLTNFKSRAYKKVTSNPSQPQTRQSRLVNAFQRFSNRSRGNSTSKYFDSTCHRFVYLLGVKYFISTCVAWVTLKTLASAKWSVLGRSRSKMCVCEHNLGGPSLSRCTALHNPVAIIAKATGKTRYAFTDTLYLDGHLISSTFMRQQQLQNCCCSKWLLRFGTLAWCLSVLWCRYFWVLIVNILTVTHVLKWQSPARNGSGVFFGTVQRFRAMPTSPFCRCGLLSHPTHIGFGDEMMMYWKGHSLWPREVLLQLHNFIYSWKRRRGLTETPILLI